MTTPPGRTAVLLMQMGGPRTLNEVEEYIRVLFSDADLVRLPAPISWFRAPLAKFVAKRRSPMVIGQYKQIGGGSPNNRITELQANNLQQLLNDSEGGDADRFRCYAAMTYTPPTTTDAMRQAVADGCTEFLALSLFPHYSSASTGASLSDLKRACAAVGVERGRVSTIETWANDERYLTALAERVQMQLLAASVHEQPPHLIISAHGVPESYVRRGDPYVDQIRDCVAALMKRLPANQAFTLCFQSRATPFKWVGPATDQTMESLAKSGVHNMVVLPISFVNDHIETLYEIDLELADIARNAGAQHVSRVPAFNADADLIQALAGLVRAKLQIPDPSTP